MKLLESAAELLVDAIKLVTLLVIIALIIGVPAFGIVAFITCIFM